MQAVTGPAKTENLETIFQAAKVGIVALDDTGKVVQMNDAARYLLGGVKEPAPFDWPSSIKLVEVQSWHAPDANADPIRQALAGENLHTTVHLRNTDEPDSDLRYLRLTSTPLNQNSDGIRVVLLLDDVTDAEQDRQISEQQAQLAALSQFTGGLAHDVNNHLATLMTAVFLAGRAQDKKTLERQLKVAEDTILRARILTASLTGFGKKHPLPAENANVARVLQGVEDLIRPMLDPSIHLDIMVDDPNLYVFCDLAQLDSALINLILNSRDAIKKSGTDGKITVSARAIDGTDGNGKNGAGADTLQITVTDDGSGMTQNIVSQATNPFFTTKGGQTGRGLGLSMVHNFARQSGGDLQIVSVPDRGTTVTLFLQRGAPQGFRGTNAPANQVIQGQGQTILVVEDNPEFRQSLAGLLQELGYLVQAASTAADALDQVHSGLQFDVLLTDVVIPGDISGYDLAATVRETHPHIPVIYISGHTNASKPEAEKITGIHLQKPANPAELSQAVFFALSKEA